MTTSLPYWEKTLTDGYSLPGLDETVFGDADYLIARMRHILTTAEGFAEEHGAGNRDAGYHLERNWLRDRVRDLTEELSLYTRAADEMFALLQRQHADISWQRCSTGFAGNEHTHTLTPGESAPRCARRLRLPAVENVCGRAAWRGRWEGFKISVYAPTLSQSDRRHTAPSVIGPELTGWLLETAPGLPPILWDTCGVTRGPDGVPRRVVLRGDVFAATHRDPAAVAAQWADALGLDVLVDGGTGELAYVGDTDRGTVQVHWVADPARWDAHIAECTDRAGGQA